MNNYHFTRFTHEDYNSCDIFSVPLVAKMLGIRLDVLWDFLISEGLLNSDKLPVSKSPYFVVFKQYGNYPTTGVTEVGYIFLENVLKGESAFLGVLLEEYSEKDAEKVFTL